MGFAYVGGLESALYAGQGGRDGGPSVVAAAVRGEQAAERRRRSQRERCRSPLRRIRQRGAQQSSAGTAVPGSAASMNTALSRISSASQ